TLIVKEEIILIAIKHIKSVNYNALACGESDESDDSKESSDNSGRARAQRQSSRGR
ncbi:spore coat protein, partial [Bacillus sp. OA1]|nr:spore coat protein [Bacillus sp. OA1]